MMFKKNIKGHHPNERRIPDNPYKQLIIEVSGPEKINALPNLIKTPDDDYIIICKNYLHVKDRSESKFLQPK